MDERQRIIAYVLASLNGRIHSTKLVKMIYFVDYVYCQNYGTTATGFKYQWDHFGPNAVGHAIVAEAHKLAIEDIAREYVEENPHGGFSVLFKINNLEEIPPLDAVKAAVIDDVIAQFGKMNIPQITAASKRTAPFKNARQYDLLELTQSQEAVRTTKEDAAAYLADIKGNPPITLDELKAEIGIA